MRASIGSLTLLRFGVIQREVYYENDGDTAFGKTNPLALLHGDEYTVLITATEFENAGKFQPATINFLYLQYDSDLITGIIDNQEFEIFNNGAIEKFNISFDFADHPVVSLEESGGGSGIARLILAVEAVYFDSRPAEFTAMTSYFAPGWAPRSTKRIAASGCVGVSP